MKFIDENHFDEIQVESMHFDEVHFGKINFVKNNFVQNQFHIQLNISELGTAQPQLVSNFDYSIQCKN